MGVLRFVVAVVLVSLSSCSSESESPVRSNLTEVYRGGLWHDDRCSEQSFEYCCLERGLTDCTTFDNVAVVAVRRLGDRIGVLIRVNGDHLALALSEDRGRTWTTLEFEDGDYARGGQAYVGGTDLVMTADGTWVYIPRFEVGGLGMQYLRGYLYRAEATPVGYAMLVTDGVVVPGGGAAIEARDGRAIFFIPDTDPRSLEVTILVNEADPTNRSNDRTAQLPCTVPGCRNLAYNSFLGTDDGELYYGLTNSGPPSPECLVGYHRGAQSLSFVCVPYSEWPGTSTEFAVLPYAGKEASVLRAFDRNDHVWASTIVDIGSGVGRPSDPVDLGPGKVFSNVSFSGWPRFRGMAIVQALAVDGITPSNLSTRIVRVPETGPAQDVILPFTTCEDDANCGYRDLTKGELIGQMTWTLSLGNDDYLVFYRSDAAAGIAATQQVISVSLEHATYKDIAGGSLPIDGAIGYIGGIEMVGVAAMCARKFSCLPSQPDEMLRCMNAWTVRPTVDAAKHHAALLHFLASPPDCSGFGTCNGVDCGPRGGDCDPAAGNGSGACAYPAASSDCNTCTPAGVAITCSGSTVTSVLDCAAVGQSCECNAGACACVAPPCTTGSTASCVGDVYTTCDVTHDCGLTQQTCGLPADLNSSFIGCSPTSTGKCASSTGFGAIWCDGKFFMVCVDGQPQSYDCKANGFSRCGFPNEFSGVPQCVL